MRAFLVVILVVLAIMMIGLILLQPDRSQGISKNANVLDYEKEGGFSPSYGVLELSDADIIEVQNELLERNPKIEIS